MSRQLITGTCANCLFREKTTRECRRNPPQVAPFPLDNQHPITYWPSPFWPTVEDNWWCGEYK